METVTLPFPNRREAGVALAKHLTAQRAALVLAVPRGGVEVAAPIAQAIGGELDLLLTRKVGAPFNPELAVGAVAPDGELLLNEALLRQLGLRPAALEREVQDAKRELQRRLELYRGARPLPAVSGRVVIVVDDGIATGFTVKAGIAWLRRHHPRKILLAVPVAPREVWQELCHLVDQAVCLATPEPFYAVGQFYADFSPTEDARVISLLKENWERLNEH